MTIDFTNLNYMPWLVPVGPLLAFFVITLFTNRAKMVPATDHHEYGGHHPDYDGMEVPVVRTWSRVASVIVGLAGVLWAMVFSYQLVWAGLNTPHFGTDGHVFTSNIDWLANGTGFLQIGVLVDPLNALMLFMVPMCVLAIFIYSIGYMAHDPRQSRFFALISLFAGAMLILVVSDNLLTLFVGWEIMGLCSYMLIGFWFEKESAYKAAVKAFTVTRVADVIMLLGIVYLWSQAGTLNFREILYNPEVLEQIASTPALIFGSFGVSAASLISIFLIIGTIGKSAQFPLHVWLPDAMEGPTPVSAMIHAAAMVSAGIYAVLRMYPLFTAGADPHHGVFNGPLMLMLVVGSFTALFASTIAVAQNDVKRVLAYSTISQLGFMMAALGMGAYIAAAFHLITHAFFKALLFMASGSVIHGMEHGEHHVHEHAHHHDEHEEHGEEHGHHFDPQDMMNMGGLRKTMPVTFITFMIGGLSLAGFPLITAGFWSKDEILADAWLGASNGHAPHLLVFLSLAFAAFLTAFYTMRQLGLTFWGEARTEEAKHANLGQGIVSLTMTLPLIMLAVFALVAGFVGVPHDFPLFGALFSSEGYNPFHHFVAESLHADLHTAAPAFNWFPVFISFLVALGGLFVGWLMYWRKPLKAGQEDPLVRILGKGTHSILENKYYVDELYAKVFVAPSVWFANVVNVFIDRGIIDGFLHLIARTANWLGEFIKIMNKWLIDGVGDGIPQAIYDVGGWMRRIQTGRVQQYLLFVLVVVILFAVIMFAFASGTVTVVQ